MKVVLYMAMTVNGMIAKDDDETPWSDEEWEAYEEAVKQAGNVIVGARTYEIMKKADEFSSIGDPFTVVVTEEPNQVDDEGVVFVSSPELALREVESEGFETALVGGGARLNTSFLEDKLVDEIVLDVEPCLFGKGVSFLAPVDIDVQLKLLEMRQLHNSHTVQLRYEVLK